MKLYDSPDRPVLEQLEDPFIRKSLRTAIHLRRYLPFYVFGTIWVITLAMFPSIHKSSNDNGTTNLATNTPAATTPGDATATTAPEAGAATTPGAVTAPGAVAAAKVGTSKGTKGAAASLSGGGTGSQAISAQQAAEAIQRETGTTRLGLPCGPGVRQFPISTYATTCQNKYTGQNGGTTYAGVTADKINIIRRKFPDSPNQTAVNAVLSEAGYASPDVVEATRVKFIEYFNKAYELYGRTVNYQVYTSTHGDQTQSTLEAESQGKENACLDAEEIKTSYKAFAVIDGSSPFSECAAEQQKMPVFAAGAYFPEVWYQQHHPYLWGTVMECERISHQVAEYIGKRLAHKAPKWVDASKDPVTASKKERYFGTYVPDNDGYQHCVQISRDDEKNKYGISDPGPKYNYQLDISRFPDQAAQAAVQFKAAGVTTVVLACDFISAIVLSEAAKNQQWWPEWMTIGTGGTDLDNSARLYDQDETSGHLFGPSELGATQKLIGPNSEPGRVYKMITGQTIPDGTDGGYFTLVHMYNLLQQAGPILTPANIGAQAAIEPVGGAPDYAGGYWSLSDGPDGTAGAKDHTEVDDSREVYWVSEPGTATTGAAKDGYYNGPDGKNGTYKETYNGKRFRNNEWPAEDPPIYPKH